MKNLVWIFLIVSVGALGFFAGKSQVAEPAAPTKVIVQESPKIDVSPEEIREYLRTQNADEKLKKADEILGKIVQALVAHFGLRLTPTEVAQFEKPLEMNPDNQPKAAPTPVMAAPREEKPAEAKAAPTSKSLLEIRREARQVDSEEAANKVLDQLSTDYAARLQSSGTLNRQQLRELRGSFDGTLTYDKDNSSVRATLSFNDSRVTSEKVIGRAQVQIFDKSGQAVSTGRSNGDLSKAYTGTQVSIFVEIGGDYMELVYFPSLDSFMGNYLQSQKGQFVKAGRINLRRVN